MEEIWKDIPDFENYQASNLGRIRSIDHFVSQYNGNSKYKRLIKGRILKKTQSKNGYYHVALSQNGKLITRNVQRLVMSAFYGKSELQIDHIDGNKQNNNINNLEYVTQKENTIRAWKNKLISRKKNLINQYDLNGNYIKTWFNAGDIEKNLKINHSLVIACCRGKRKQTKGYIFRYNQEQ